MTSARSVFIGFVLLAHAGSILGSRLLLNSTDATADGSQQDGVIVHDRAERMMFVVQGAILAKYTALGGATGWLGAPTSDELTTTDGVGRYNTFEHGVIYWTSATGAHEVHGNILTKWRALGAEKSPVGYPISDELASPGGTGRMSKFQRGNIYWSSATGAFEVHGAIFSKYVSLQSATSLGVLGFPTTDERKTPDGIGRFNGFQNGMIYWTPATGAHELHGKIFVKWSGAGFETSTLGYPISDVTVANGVQSATFQNGVMTYTKATDTYAYRSSTITKHHAFTWTGGQLDGVNGFVDLVVDSSGHFTFSGHIQNPYTWGVNYVAGAVLMTPSGVGYTFGHQGTVGGLLSSRVDDFSVSGTDPKLAADWSNILAGKFKASTSGQDSWTSAISSWLTTLVNELAQWFGKVAKEWIISLTKGA